MSTTTTTTASTSTAQQPTTTTTPTTTTNQPPPPPPPVSGQTIDTFPFSGTVLVNGQPLQAGQQIPVGSIIDATHGTVTLETVGPNGQIQFASFTGGVFRVDQQPGGITVLTLLGGNFDICPTKKNKRHVSAKPTAKPTTVVRSLWGNGQGNFETKGRYAAATVRGTIWLTADRCDGTDVTVRRGIVAVQDFVRNKTILVKAPQSYLAKAPK